MGTGVAALETLRRTFAERDVVALDGVFAPALIDGLTAAVADALDTRGARRELRMRTTGGSLRRYRIAGRDALAAAAPLIDRTYRSTELLASLAAIVGEAVAPVPYVSEEFIATRLEYPGDVHDWHWDDYSYALVWVLRAPPAEAGACVEFVRNVPWDKADPRVDELLAQHPVERFQPPGGSVYLLRANATLHRVSPLSRPGVRDMLCFSYASGADARRTITHETIEALTCA